MPTDLGVGFELETGAEGVACVEGEERAYYFGLALCERPRGGDRHGDVLVFVSVLRNCEFGVGLV
jgi:hypothetical protein